MPAKHTDSLKISNQERLLLTRHLAAMVKAGIPIADALATLRDQQKPGNLQRILVALTKSVESGSTVSQAFALHPRSFSAFYTGMIAISEESGTLADNMAYLASQLAKQYQLRRKVQGAILYPVFILVVALAMGSFLAFFVLPKLLVFFESLQVELPLSTRILLGLAQFFQQYGLWLAGALLVGTGLLALAARSDKIRPFLERFLLHVPLVNSIIRTSQVVQITRNWGVLIKSGVPINRALQITQSTTTNLTYQASLQQLASAIEKGQSIHQAIDTLPARLYPLVVSRMLAVGEQTGSVDEVLLYLSDFYEEELDAVTKSLTTMLEPMLLLAIGLGIGFLALAIITPIYELTGSIQ